MVNQPISYADIIAIVPHFAARIQFEKDYYEVMGETIPTTSSSFGTNPYLAPRCASAAGRRWPRPEGLVPADATSELIAWFKRTGLGPAQLCMFAPTCTRAASRRASTSPRGGRRQPPVLDQYASQRKLGKRPRPCGDHHPKSSRT